MRTALQAAAREAHKLFTNAASGGADSGGGAGNSPYGPSTPKSTPPTANATVPWQSPAEDGEEDFDHMVDDSYQEPDEGDPYVVQDFDDDDDGATNYPESHNANMSALQTKEYVKGAVEISEDPDGDYTKNIVSRVSDGRFDDDDDGATATGTGEDDDENY